MPVIAAPLSVGKNDARRKTLGAHQRRRALHESGEREIHAKRCMSMDLAGVVADCNVCINLKNLLLKPLNLNNSL